jgi:tripartite-type tricarboxylate transporter receptor subunit TctC
LKTALLSFFASSVLALAAHGQPFPHKPLKLIVADGPGSISDLRARQVGARLGERLGQPVVVENRPGASMTIAATAAARSAQDGYTLFLGNVVTHSLNPLLFKTLSYNPEDFTPVTMLSTGPLILCVHPSLAARSLEELIALARTQPGKLSYGVIGQGSPQHIVMEQIKALRGAHFELVPYKSTAQYIQDLLAGRLHVALNFWPVLGPQVKAGTLRALAVAAPRRLEAAPDVPTFAEAGLPGIEGGAWQGIMVPAGTSRAIVIRLQTEIAQVLSQPDIRSQIIDNGSEVGGNTPEEFASYIRTDRTRWKKAVAQAGIEPN